MLILLVFGPNIMTGDSLNRCSPYQVPLFFFQMNTISPMAGLEARALDQVAMRRLAGRTKQNSFRLARAP